MPFRSKFIKLCGRPKRARSPCPTTPSPEPPRPVCYLLRLPRELLFLCALYLDQQSLSRFIRTCRFTHQFRADFENQSHRAPAHTYAEWYTYRREVQEYGEILVMKPSDPPEPLRNAVIEGNYHLVKLFLEDHVDPNSWDVRGSYMLNLAAQKHQYDIAQLLLQFGADPNRGEALTLDLAVEDRLIPRSQSALWFELLLPYGAKFKKRKTLVCLWMTERGDLLRQASRNVLDMADVYDTLEREHGRNRDANETHAILERRRRAFVREILNVAMPLSTSRPMLEALIDVDSRVLMMDVEGCTLFDYALQCKLLAFALSLLERGVTSRVPELRNAVREGNKWRVRRYMNAPSAWFNRSETWQSSAWELTWRVNEMREELSYYCL
ncbi:uncharacterized protein BO80DRAFT_450370 [Aspergillus ibericus CBS 121593]|uniref:Uncharacterized protein n=1 Tax=Aspergillus ibericus CBS 121593 TaxID=1448316 RepID=A0A395GMJ3_9EURO|nr:hypothetical protein BO80DRAFT_450370 [Aspergillus ibericus CBS 121593]RAK95233.1 hypothetical protein BO80DRAFT_450370 [Aspergillus ibericus CBS 121593]